MVLLSDLWAARWSWAATAMDDVRGRLAPELRHLVGGGAADVSVVLYGPTGVGKTTLLLTLLGVAERHRSEVSRILQAGRTSGQSSTSVPIRYRWSPSADAWELAGAVEAERCSGEELMARLRRLRDATGDRRGTPDLQPVTVGLPRGCRSADAGPAMPHVLDLPGVAADDPTERAAVRQFVQRHVPLADLVVIVVESEKMGLLVEALSSVELDWLSWPDRFRIVLTHTATHGYGNDPQFRERTDSIGRAEIREVVCEKLARSVPELLSGRQRQRLKTIFYPIEYGKSWAKAKDRERALFGPVFAELLQELGQQIGLTAVDDGRYLALPRAAKAIQAHYDRRRDEITHRISDHLDSRRKTEDNLRRLWKALAEADESLAEAGRLQKLAATAAVEASGITVHLPPPAVPMGRGQCQLEEQRNAVRHMVRDSADAWHEGSAAALSAAARHAMPMALMRDSEADRVLADVHGGDHRCRDGWSRVLPALLLTRCHARLASEWPQVTDRLQAMIRSAAQRWVEEAAERLPPPAAAQQVHKAALAQVDRANGELEAADRALHNLADEQAACDADATESEKVTATILTEIDVQWRRHVNDLYRRIAQTADPDDAGRLALAVLLAHHCRDRMSND